MKTFKMIFIILMMGTIYSCAPHYYLFETLSMKKHITNDNIFVENKTFINMHLNDNQVMIKAQYEIVNKSNKEILIDSKFFSIQSKFYDYQVLSLHQNNLRSISSSKKIDSNSSIYLLPYDSISIAVYYNLGKKIEEKKFVKERLHDTVTNSININGNDYIYMFKPIERKTK